MMEVPQGKFDLTRGETDDGSLRAWDAADEYILNHLVQTPTPVSGRTLIVNDGFGALAVALARHSAELVSWSDSVSSHNAMALNLKANGLGSDHITALGSTEDPNGAFDLVLIKVPKHNSLLEDQLHRMRLVLTDTSVVVGGGMTRHIHTSTLELFESILGTTKTSLARKKARLVFVDFDSSVPVIQNPWPVSWQHDGAEVTNRAGVFSARKLDIGTRFLLENLPTTEGAAQVVDLGCGNGIIGATFLARNQASQCVFIDESYGAVASAQATVTAAGAENRATFVVADIMGPDERLLPKPSSLDLVLNNPPFHSNAALSSHAATEMFRASHTLLRPGGELVVVGNRHLGYHVALNRLFGNCRTSASNAKFVVLRAVR